MGHHSTLLRRILLAMGLSSLPLAAQYGCVGPRGPAPDDDDTGSDPLDIDDDEDGYSENNGDCDDSAPDIYPGAVEICDEVDNDCDGTTDEDDASDAQTWYPDGDGDGYGDEQEPRSACEQPQGFVADSSDCNDQNDEIHPAASEVCDEVDNDCDGTTDEDDASDAQTWYEDSDDDGHGNPQSSILACEQPDGFLADSSDCDDSNGAVSPSSPELPGDGLDNNCSGFIDEVDCADAPQATDITDIPTNLPADVMFCDVLPPSGLCPEPTVVYIEGLINVTVGNPMGMCHWYVINSCGPDDSRTPDCCYVVELEQACAVPGRPLRIDGTPRLAPLVPSGAWSEQVEAEFSSLPAERRDALLARWSEAAQLEHASVASFARFNLQLLAVGAPPDLIAGATRAQADEIAHARSCFGVASVLAGRELGPGPLDMQGTWSGQTDMAELLEENLREGCINETLAAAEAAWLAERCTVPALAKTLGTIAADETRHAALAWRTARWILQQRPDLRDLAARILSSATALESDSANLPHDDAWMAEYGCMPAKAAAELRSEVWQQVLAPSRSALLGSLERQDAA
jgi:hypothetical protein